MTTENKTNLIFITAFSTLVAELLTLPICTIKTNYQTSQMTTIRTIKHIYSNYGLKGFIMASNPAIISQMVSTTSKFTIYEQMKKIRKTNEKNIFDNAINGMIGGIIGCTITHPIDVWKIYNQRGESIKDLYSKSIKENNLIKNFYSGYTGSLSKNIILYSMLFPLNDYFKNKFNNIFISAPLTTICISTVLQPFDYYKTVVISGQKPQYFFRGMHLMVARSIPHFSLTMFLIDFFRNK